MALFFLASIAGLFPGLTLPMELGWKAVHPFDLIFVACLGLAASRRAFRAPDWPLILAGSGLVAAGGIALWIHPSTAGFRAVITLAYSLAVLLAVSHIDLEALDVRIDRTIVWPLLIAVGVAGVVFALENVLGLSIGPNNPRSLPAGLHRFGGLTGANALILFLGLGGPFVRASWLTTVAILLPAYATLSRGLLGVGIALLTRERWKVKGSWGRVLLLGSLLGIALGLFAYAFALVPVKSAQRTSFNVSLEPGGYLTLHHAALRMLQSHPFVGVGPGQFVKEYRGFTSQAERDYVFEEDVPGWAPHSAVLGLAAEQGLPALAALGWLFHLIFRRLSRIPDPELRASAMAGLTGLLVGGHFVDWLTLKGLWLWIGLMVASRSSAQGNLPPTAQ